MPSMMLVMSEIRLELSLMPRMVLTTSVTVLPPCEAI